MAELSYNPSVGNGIADAGELLQHLASHPLAFYEVRFMDSYLPLLAPKADEALKLFDEAAQDPKLLKTLDNVLPSLTLRGVFARRDGFIRQRRGDLERSWATNKPVAALHF